MSGTKQSSTTRCWLSMRKHHWKLPPAWLCLTGDRTPSSVPVWRPSCLWPARVSLQVCRLECGSDCHHVYGQPGYHCRYVILSVGLTAIMFMASQGITAGMSSWVWVWLPSCLWPGRVSLQVCHLECGSDCHHVYGQPGYHCRYVILSAGLTAIMLMASQSITAGMSSWVQGWLPSCLWPARVSLQVCHLECGSDCHHAYGQPGYHCRYVILSAGLTAILAVTLYTEWCRSQLSVW